jgi:uncharacterized UPF0160 family protein
MEKERTKYAIIRDGFTHASHIFSKVVLERMGYEVKFLSKKEMKRFKAHNPLCTILLVGFEGSQYESSGYPTPNPINGMPFSCFGLIWRDFGRRYIESVSDYELDTKRIELIFEDVSKTFLSTIDGQDRGVRPVFRDHAHRVFTLSDALVMMANGSYDGKEAAFTCAQEVLWSVVRESERSFRMRDDFDLQLEASSDPRVLVLDEYIKYHGYIHEEKYKDILYLIFPSISDDEGYNIIAIVEKGNLRKPLPRYWVKSGDKQLGVTYCHEGRYIAHTNTLDEAIKAAFYAADLNETE